MKQTHPCEQMDDYINHLFPYLPKDKIRKVSCGHVIPKENMLAMTVPFGASGQTFEFNFERRNDPSMVSSNNTCYSKQFADRWFHR